MNYFIVKLKIIMFALGLIFFIQGVKVGLVYKKLVCNYFL